MAHAEAKAEVEVNIIVRNVSEDHDNFQVNQAEEAIEDNHPIKKGFGSLIHGENDHWHICPQYQSTCEKLFQPQHQQHGVITRAEELMLQCVHH